MFRIKRAHLDYGDRRPRVLQVHHGFYPTIQGGVDRVVAELLEVLGSDQAVLFEVGDLNDRALSCRKDNRVRIYRKRLRPMDGRLSWPRRIWARCEWFHALFQLARMLHRERIDVVHLHTLQDYQLYFRTLSRLFGYPYIVTLHRGETLAFPERPVEQRRRWTDILRGATKVTAVSETLAQAAKRKLPIREKPVVVYNGISEPIPALYQPDAVVPSERSYAICVGALRHYKGHDIAIRAWGMLIRQGVELDLAIAGEGELREALTEQAEAEGCLDRIHFLGAVPHNQVIGLVRDAAFYLMPSRNEGLGLALLEAASLYKPIIASDIPVFREIVSDGRSALLFTPEDAGALAEQVRRILGEPGLVGTLGQGAREAYLAGFSPEAMLAGYKEVFRQVLADSRDSPFL